MLAELFKAVSEQAVCAEKTHIIKPSAEPAHVYYLQTGNNQPERIEAEPSPRNHKCYSLASFISVVKSLRPDDEIDRVVWYSRTACVCVLDDRTRRDLVTYPLTLSPQVLALLGLEQRKPTFSQADFIKLLRITFAGCTGPAGNLLEIVRKLKFRSNEAGQSEITQGKVSLGRSLEAELTGAGTLPDETAFDVPVFTGDFAPVVRMKLAIEVDPKTQTFQLIPFPGEIENAIQAAEGDLGSELREELTDIGVFHGQPS